MCQTLKRTRVECPIVENSIIAKDIYKMVLKAPEIIAETLPGQFVNLYCGHKGRLLPRPISVCEIDGQEGLLTLVYAVVGAGTREFSELAAGDTIEAMGPFGNGFKMETDKPAVLVGGGVGTPPMLELAKQLEGEKTIVVGFRSEPYLVEALEQYGKVLVATDDGSHGFHGNVVALLEQEGIASGRLYACGPTPMLKGLKEFAKANGMQAQLSLEERMGCGFGGCVGCAVKVPADNKAGYTYKKVCKDGPVFKAEEVLFE